MTVWALALVALIAATCDAQGSNVDLCARMCPSSQPQCPTPCQQCPSCPACPAVHCPSLPQIPACPSPVVNLTCPTTSCVCPTCPPPPPNCVCPTCPPAPKCPSPPSSPRTPPRGYRTEPDLGTYRLYQEKMKWLDANLTCSHDGGYLAIPNSLDELNHFLIIMSNNGVKFIHIGFHDMTDENTFSTSTGQPMNAIQQTLWGDGEPNGGRAHNCAYLHYEKRRIMDEPCQDSEAFMCEI